MSLIQFNSFHYSTTNFMWQIMLLLLKESTQFNKDVHFSNIGVWLLNNHFNESIQKCLTFFNTCLYLIHNNNKSMELPEYISWSYPSRSRYKHYASWKLLPCVFTQCSVERDKQSTYIHSFHDSNTIYHDEFRYCRG